MYFLKLILLDMNYICFELISNTCLYNILFVHNLPSHLKNSSSVTNLNLFLQCLIGGHCSSLVTFFPGNSKNLIEISHYQNRSKLVMLKDEDFLDSEANGTRSEMYYNALILTIALHNWQTFFKKSLKIK